MADCNIRNVDEKLVRAMKVAAAVEGISLRGWVIGVWGKAVGIGQSELNSRKGLVVERDGSSLGGKQSSERRVPKGEREQIIKSRSLGMTTAMREGLDVGKPQKPVAKIDPRDRNPLKIEPGFWVSPDGERTCGHGCKRCGKCGKPKGARDGVEHS
jgi:hypothetical protein